MVVCDVAGALNNYFWKPLFSRDCEYTLKRRTNCLVLQVKFQAISVIFAIIFFLKRSYLNCFRNECSLEVVHSIS